MNADEGTGLSSACVVARAEHPLCASRLRIDEVRVAESGAS